MADSTKTRAARQAAPPAKAVEGRVLTDEEAQAFLASSTSRGDYSQIVASFLESGNKAEVIPTATGPLSGRSARAIKSGLKTAAKDKGVKVHERNGEIALFRA